MPAEIVPAEFCADYFSVFEVPSESDPSKTYEVTMNGGENLPHCTCPAFQYSREPAYDRTCKHIKYVWEHACLWNPQWKEGGPRDIQPKWLPHNIIQGSKCPACGGPTVGVMIAV